MSPSETLGREGVGEVVDAHVHYWDPGSRSYAWLEELPVLRRLFGPGDFRSASEGIPVAGRIFVECNCAPSEAVEEARAMSALVEEGELLGIVAFADLTRPGELRGILDEYERLPGLRGVRHNIQGHPSGFALTDTFVEGVREVGRRGFTFDLCATHDQLDDVVELARRCPDTRLVLDHCGKPDIAGGGWEPWGSWISRLAEQPHVWCKLSGLLTESGSDHGDEKLRPYASHVLSAFGPGRLMYGGDWPVLTLAGTYREWYEFTRRFTEGWAETERSRFYRENALEFYGIEQGRGDGVSKARE